MLDFDFDKKYTPESQKNNLVSAIGDQMLMPVIPLSNCKRIELLLEEGKYFLVWFGDQDIFETPYNTFYEVAKREIVSYGDNRVLFYTSVDKTCAKKWVGNNLKRDAAVLYLGAGQP